MGVLTRVGIVVGMRSEARLAEPLLACDWIAGIEIGGGHAEGGRAAAQRLLAGGADGLISFGLAGGLVDAMPAGALLCPQAVVVDGATLDCDAGLAARLAVSGAQGGVLLHSERVVTAASEKRALGARHGCVALDMESGAVAGAAKAAGIGFAVLRAVCDPVSRDLPDAAAAALDAGGGVAAGRLALAVLRRPATLVALIGLGRDAHRGQAALRAAVAGISDRSGP